MIEIKTGYMYEQNSNAKANRKQRPPCWNLKGKGAKNNTRTLKKDTWWVWLSLF